MHIAVCGELGAGCTEVGQILSKTLGLRCINSAGIIRSIVIDFRGVHPGETFEEFEDHVQSGEVNLDKMIQGKIDEMLATGDTIVEGRSAFMLLDREDTLKALLVAPQSARVEHIAKRRNITPGEAREAVRVSDTERKHVVEKLFRKDWLAPHNFDLVMNTRSRSYQEVADLIVKAMKRK
ncbi:MAG: cytidylate kinase-like family protein [Candidatus Bathyarchaeota archaeon]|nr:cytidylate kinase-like family protein [Candidatus Bathyarchaeota archaeon]